MDSAPAQKPPKPYWYVDMKWVFGILFSTALSVNILLFILTKLTSPEIALPIASQIVASQFSKEGLDEKASVEDLKQKILKSGADRYYPFGEDKGVVITRQDVQTLSARDLRLKVFRQLVEPVYFSSGNVNLEQYGFLNKFNIKTHYAIKRFYRISFIPVAVFVVPYSFFSFGLGRLLNPAFTILSISGPIDLLLFAILNSGPPPGDGGPLTYLPRDLMLEIVKIFKGYFDIYVGVAGGLILLSIIIKIVQIVKSGKQNKASATKKE